MEVKLKTDIVNGTVTVSEGTILKVVKYSDRLYTGSGYEYDRVLLENDEYSFYLSLQALSILTEEIKTKWKK